MSVEDRAMLESRLADAERERDSAHITIGSWVERAQRAEHERDVSRKNAERSAKKAAEWWNALEQRTHERDEARAEAAALREAAEMVAMTHRPKNPKWPYFKNGPREPAIMQDPGGIHALGDLLANPSPAVARMLAAVEVAEAADAWERAWKHSANVGEVMDAKAPLQAALARWRELDGGT
jgi:hypothetical protein